MAKGKDCRRIAWVVFSAVYGQVCIILMLAFLMSPLIFFQEFRKTAEGMVVRSQVAKGGYDLDLDNGTSFYWIVKPLVTISEGDHVRKEKNSFRYVVNGKHMLKREDAMTFVWKIPPKVMFPLLVCLTLISFLYYAKTKKAIFLDVFAKNVGKSASVTALCAMPLMLICYAALYWAMGFWT